MALSNAAIKDIINQGHLKIYPLTKDAIRPASVCLHLSETLLIFDPKQGPVDPTDASTYPLTKPLSISHEWGYDLAPNEFVLAATLESIGLSKNLAGHVSNISGLARLGITVALSTHVAPGFGECCPRPLTLEIHNVSIFSVRIRPGIRICHLILSAISPPASIGYDEMFPDKYLGGSPCGSQFAE